MAGRRNLLRALEDSVQQVRSAYHPLLPRSKGAVVWLSEVSRRIGDDVGRSLDFGV